MKYADIIVPNGKENTKAIEFIINNLKLQIPQDDLEKISQKGSTKQLQNDDNDLSPIPMIKPMKEDLSPDPTQEGKVNIFKKLLKPKDEKKLGIVLEKLLKGSESPEDDDDLTEIMIDYLF